ncbi:hypothetical protein GCM10009743_32470 [Kribbella swartbergensis]
MPSPPAAEIAAVSVPPLTFAIGAPTTGTDNPNFSVSHMDPGHHTRPAGRHGARHTERPALERAGRSRCDSEGVTQNL